MAWFGDKLSQFSNLTDQISSFTKEVLTETTEEVEDPSAELQIARKRISDLEAVNEHTKTEYEKLKAHNEEVSERLETSECQISAISQEYRKLLQEKEEELKRYRKDNERLREEHKHLVSQGASAQSPLKELAGSKFFQNGSELETVDLGGACESDWVGEFHDFSDVVTSQSVINQLQGELARLKVECQHWKDAATSAETSSTDDSQKLRDEIKDLQASLQREVEQHHRELSSLQSVHSERVHTLTSRHQAEIEQLQRQVSDADSVWKTRCGELEREMDRLKESVSKSESLEEELLTARELNSRLESDLRVSTAKKAQLEERLAESVCALEKEKECQMRKLDEEKCKLQAQLGDLQSSISHHQSVISGLQEDHKQSQNEIEHLRANIETLEVQVTQREAEIHSLKQRQSTQESMEEGHSLEGLTPLREQVREESVRTANSHEMQTMSRKVQTLESDRDRLTKMVSEKDCVIQQLTGTIEGLKSQLLAKDSAQKSTIEEVNARCMALTHDLEVKQEECVKYSKQLSQLRSHLLEVEERYTQDALKADQRETALRQELTQLQQRAADTTNQDTQQNRVLLEQLSRTQDELHTMTEQRDDALLQMSNAQEQAHQNATSLQNLQTVLEQFQRDQSSELAQALKRSQAELADSHTQCAKLQDQLCEAEGSIKALVALKQELSKREETLNQLHKELEVVSQALEEEKKERRKLSSNSVERVDRALVKNLVLGYVHAPDAKKPEVLQLISKILGFTEEELAQAVGRGRGKGWLWGLWSGPQSQQESLSHLFVQFLENESTPHSVTSPTQVTGYVDSRTDPDRPSLATAALLRPHPPPTVESHPPTHAPEPHPLLPASPPTLTTLPSRPTTATPPTTKQSSILGNILNS